MGRPFTLLITTAALALSVLSACGGGSSSSSSSNPPGPPGTGGGTGGGSNPGGSIVSPTIVTVSSGGTVSGVDVMVPSGAPGVNANVLGTAALSSTSGSASSTGDVIHRGATRTVLIFGQGLSSKVEITISGPADISISNPTTIKADSGKPGVEFTAVVDPNAALGARTVRLRSVNDIATFTGGLEVIP